jgi:hypothetical protein
VEEASAFEKEESAVMMYQYYDMDQMQKVATEMPSDIEKGAIGDFYRTGIEIYVGSFPDVSGPDLVIDPHDHAAVELFKDFAGKLAEHYKNLKL